MQLTYLTRYSRVGPSSRYRVFQFEDLYRASGIRLETQPLFEERYFEILRGRAASVKKIPYIYSRYRERMTYLRSHRSGLFVVEHQLFPFLPVAIERSYLPDRFLMEFDDAIYLKHPRKLPAILSRAAAVIAGNEVLAAYASRFNAKVHVVPTVLDTEKYRPRPKPESEKIRIGWIGLEYNFGYLRALAPVFQRLLSRHPVEIVIVSGSPPRNAGFPFRFVRWDGDREVEQINEFDIGVMPLENDEWSRGKCGMKLLQFMALGVPAVASPVGANVQILSGGGCGLLAETHADWERQLELLVLDAGLRKRIGEAAHERIRKEYSVEVWFPRLKEILMRYAAVLAPS